ncbi:Transcriptional regulator, MarR/EmrR family protein [Carnobacterium sp. AT7]|uniref:MarR family winged helix-turn-helix transcriptional regulator n=2 Tax=Carnobacteriaceae TaxID=186828 RepID=UPI00015F2FCB|nr:MULTISPECIES: MarR family transcriptional regulator [Carnobacterium]EDP67539.1 Transcriptional regulator, MarR/EmrR family protein [Carnobacterium sp. AT7]
MEIRKLMNFIQRNVKSSNIEDKRLSMTKMHGMIIGFLNTSKHKDVFQKDIEKAFSMRRSTTSKMLKNMEEKGLIERISSEQDARMKKLQLSEKGQSLVEEVSREYQRIENLLTEGLSEKELEQFFTVIYKMQQNMLKDIE